MGSLACIRISDKFTRPALLSGSAYAAMPYYFEVLRGWRVMNVSNSASKVLGLRFDAFGVDDFRLLLGRHQPEAPLSRPRLPQRRLPSQVPLRNSTAGTGTDELPGTA
jgi:hypothetical protein